ncbi:MAG: PQQ-dependent sugar dehydrogenase [Gemmatimonadetes bacterium]|nr:PQQ-dependent sugar dehydrogenase [Gemmatimonadota bacterium]
MKRGMLLMVTAALVAGCVTGPSGPGMPGFTGTGSDLTVVQIADGFASPVFLTHQPGDDRLFVVEQLGRISIIDNGTVQPVPFLDISAIVQIGNEQGLLSVAFHPDYDINGYFYVYYTDFLGASRIVRYTGTAVLGDPDSDLDILTVPQPFANHNGGLLEFGPDGMLYIGLGDGGSAGDPLLHGQDPTTLLGTILRIDVDDADPGLEYGIPADNPFVGSASGADEVWAYGLRNPWRYAFDAVDGLLLIADVGQNSFEEINVVDDDRGGLNFGWNVMEGNSCFLANNCNMTGLELPALTYENGGNACSVTGGYVYRGSELRRVGGHYFFSDFCGGFLRSFRYDNGSVADLTDWGVNAGAVTSFGEDVQGELYMLTGAGQVLKIVESQ